MNLGKNIRYLRKKMGLRQEDLAKLVEKDFTTIQKWETEKAEPNLLMTSIMANYFNVNLDDLVKKDLENERAESMVGDSFDALKTALMNLKTSGISDVNELSKIKFDALSDVAVSCMNLFLSKLE